MTLFLIPLFLQSFCYFCPRPSCHGFWLCSSAAPPCCCGVSWLCTVANPSKLCRAFKKSTPLCFSAFLQRSSCAHHHHGLLHFGHCANIIKHLLQQAAASNTYRVILKKCLHWLDLQGKRMWWWCVLKESPPWNSSLLWLDKTCGSRVGTKLTTSKLLHTWREIVTLKYSLSHMLQSSHVISLSIATVVCKAPTCPNTDQDLPASSSCFQGPALYQNPFLVTLWLLYG